MLDENNELNVNKNGILYLNEIRKWANFVSIIGFIMTGLIVVIGLGFGSIISSLPQNEELPFNFNGAFGMIYVVMGALYFFPTYFLFKFASNTKTALLNKDEISFEEALRYLKSFFKFIGIMLIVVLGLYALIFLGLAAGGLFSLTA